METSERKAVIRELMSIHPLFRKKFLNRLVFPFEGLSKSQYDVLMSLNLYSAMNMGQLAMEADVSLQQITKTVNALEDMGLVQRYIDKANRRQVWVSLTDSCKEDIRNFCAKHDCFLVQSFAQISDEDMEKLHEAAQTVKQIINKMEDRPLKELPSK